MATLTDIEKRKVRNAIERKANDAHVPITWSKAAVNDAAQAVEDLLVSSASTISTVINNATSPYGITFTPAEKKWIVALTILFKHNRDMM